MSGCQYNSRLDAWYDGQLDAQQSKAISDHLPGCAECAQEARKLRDLSQSLSQVEFGEMSQIELARLHRKLARGEDGGLLRLTTALTAVAASILIISVVWLTQGPSPTPTTIAHETTQQLPAWERMASGEDPSRIELPGIWRPGMNPANTGVAEAPERDTIDWMLRSVTR